MAKLDILDLTGTKITAAGVTELQKALPAPHGPAKREFADVVHEAEEAVCSVQDGIRELCASMRDGLEQLEAEEKQAAG